MARIINNTVSPVLTLFVKVIHENGSETVKSFKVDDTVENFRYAHERKIKTISGRVAEIIPKIGNTKRFYTNAAKLMSYFKYDVTPDTIVIDASEKWLSDLCPIPVREILEDDEVVDVERIETWLGYGFTDEILLSDNTINTFALEEGQFVEDIEYLSKGTEVTFSGRLVAITYNKKLIPESLKFIVDGKLKSINVVSIKSVGNSLTPVDALESLNDAITAADDAVYLGVGTYEDTLRISKSIKILGAKAGLSAAKTSRDKKKFTNESILTGKITITDAVDVVLDGVVLTKDAFVDFGNAKSIEIKNCMFEDLVPDEARSRSEVAIIQNTVCDSETLVKISHCYFGGSASETDLFSTISMYCKLADGSSIDNNYFKDESASHNNVSIYGVAENATVSIRNNVWEMSKNAIRVGTFGDPKYTLMVEGNTYNDTDKMNPDYAGLLIVQPSGFDTTGWKNTTIYINKTNHKDKLQLFYLYSDGEKALPFTSGNLPSIFVNGKVQDLTKYIQATDPVIPDKPDVPDIPDVPEVNTEELDEAIAAAEALDSSLYTEETYANVLDALGVAKTVDRTNQDAVDNATQELQNAINALELKEETPPVVNPPEETVNTEELDRVIAEAKVIDGTLYTEKSYNDMLDALALAEACSRESQNAVDNAARILTDAIENLVLKEEPPVVNPPEEPEKTLMDLINEAETGAVIELEEGFETDEEVEISKPIHLKASSGATIGGPIVVTDPVDVVLEGITLTRNALVNIGEASNFKMTACTVSGLTPDLLIPAASVCAIYSDNVSTETVVQIENCEFGGNVREVYNTINLYSVVKDGSYFKNNHFAEDSCTHNHINLYNIEENATIEISGNEWEMSKNAIRLGPKGNPTYTVNITDNIYNDTDTDNPDYAGLLILQPFKTETTGWGNATINMTDNIHVDELQLFYLYAGANNTKFHENSMPTIYVDGELQDLTKYIQEFEEKPTPPEEKEKTLQELFDEVEEGGTLYLTERVYDTPLNITKSMTISGLKANAENRDIETLEGESVISGPIAIVSGVDITIDGVALTGAATLDLNTANSFTLKHSIIKGYTPDSSISEKKVCGIYNEAYDPMLVTIVDNYFADPAEGYNIFNLININAALKDGSSISMNYFSENCCTHNQINLYNVEEGANVEICKNNIRMSKNAIRLGIVGNPTYTMNIDGNNYNDTDTANPDYAGLLLIQPKNTETEGWNNAIININNTTHTDDLQLFYLYAGETDTPFTSENIPTINVNGVKQDLSKYLPEVPETPDEGDNAGSGGSEETIPGTDVDEGDAGIN